MEVFFYSLTNIMKVSILVETNKELTMEQRPRSTTRTIAEWLPIIWFFGGGGLVLLTGKIIAPAPMLVAITILFTWLIVFMGTVLYNNHFQSDRVAKRRKLRTEVLKNLACCKYEWSDPKIHGISDIYDLELTERTDVNEYALTIHSTHLGILIGFKGRNIDLVHSVIDDIFGYKIKIDFKEPDLFKNLYKKD